jgi:hypothetical protein
MHDFFAELPQPLHLTISSENPRSVEDAKTLAENLLETIRRDSFSYRCVFRRRNRDFFLLSLLLSVPLLFSGCLHGSVPEVARSVLNVHFKFVTM